MKRIEIIFSQSIEDDIFASMRHIPAAQFFTLIPGVRGKGNTTPKMDSPVWPEVNELLLIYCDEGSEAPIREAIDTVRARYPNEGLALFVM